MKPATIPAIDSSEMLTVPEFARMGRFSTRHGWTLLAAKKIPHYRLSPRCVRVKKSDALAFFESKRCG